MRMTLQGVDEILRKITSSPMPVKLDYVDPFTSQPTVLYKEDLIRLLVPNVHDLVSDAQVLPPLYVELSRAQRACEFSAKFAEARYRQWKSDLANKARDAAKKKEEKFTEAMGEEAYRTHKDYAAMSSESSRWELYASLLSDVKEAVKLKGQLLNGQLHNVMTHERLMQAGDPRLAGRG